MNAEAPGPTLGRWSGWLLRRPTQTDLVAAVAVVLLGAGTIVAGRRATTELTPRAALEVGRMLDDFELPIRLPDAPLVDDSGGRETLLARIREPHAVVTFYAPWCDPCQTELPELVSGIRGKAQVLIVVSRDENPEETRRQLANLGLAELASYVDVTDGLFRNAHVSALPTTYLVNPSGGVLWRKVGYSPMAIKLLEARLAHSPSGPGNEGAP